MVKLAFILEDSLVAAQELPHLLAVAFDLEDTSVVAQDRDKYLARLKEDKYRAI